MNKHKPTSKSEMRRVYTHSPSMAVERIKEMEEVNRAMLKMLEELEWSGTRVEVYQENLREEIRLVKRVCHVCDCEEWEGHRTRGDPLGACTLHVTLKKARGES